MRICTIDVSLSLSLFFSSPPSLSSCYVQNISSFDCPLQSNGTAMWIRGPAFTAGGPAFVGKYEEKAQSHDHLNSFKV